MVILITWSGNFDFFNPLPWREGIQGRGIVKHNKGCTK
jgi:hypothetical protein